MSDSAPLVSIVTPVYNHASYIKDTIESVLNQTYKNIEYIVINDGSTDETERVLSQYSDSIIWLTQENKGQAAALNKGWGMSKGRYIGYLSSDDLLVPDAVEKLVASLLATKCILVYPDYDLIDASGVYIKSVEAPEYDEHDMKSNLVCHPGPGALFSKTVFDKTGGWLEGVVQVPDFEFWLRFSCHGNFMRLPMALALSRVHEESLSFQKLSPERCVEIIDVVTMHYKQGTVDKMGMAYAHVLGCRNLLHAGLFMKALKEANSAFFLSPRIVLQKRFWRLLAGAMLHNFYYFFINVNKNKNS